MPKMTQDKCLERKTNVKSARAATSSFHANFSPKLLPNANQITIRQTTTMLPTPNWQQKIIKHENLWLTNESAIKK